MTALKNIKFEWKWLANQLNNLIDAINARTISVPLGGGIDIQETTSGTLIALSSSGVLAAPGSSSTNNVNLTPDNTVPSWQTVNVIDNSTGVCVTKTMKIWGTKPV
jgi:hypothetical protein